MWLDLTIVIVCEHQKGLKTGMYYLRSRAAADAIKFTVDTGMLKVNTSFVLHCESVIL